jgi:filamentous hemagglutinin family protein
MNHTFRHVWSDRQQRYVTAAENTRSRGKGAGSARGSDSCKLLAGALLSATVFLSPPAMAGPKDGVITVGAGSIAQSGNSTVIQQNTDKLAINWSSFNIGTSESVRFNQPSSSSIALNRVTGLESSSILGSLTANGNVFVLNPNGFLIGSNAQVNVGGLLLSTRNLSDADFNAGNFKFSGNSNAQIVNQGTINVPVGGKVAFLAANINNTGSISASKGSVLLGAANAYTLTFADGSPMGYSLDSGTANAMINNGGMIVADGGRVVLTTKGIDQLSQSVVNNTGLVQAQTVSNQNGSIELLADMSTGTTNVAGSLDASAPSGGNGGFIETSGAQINVSDSVKVSSAASSGKVGNWLIDPVDFKIAATGGNITGSALGSLLESNSITVIAGTGTASSTTLVGSAGTNGDVFVNDAVTWGGATTFTMNASRNIYINKNVTATNASGKVALQFGQGAVASGNMANYIIAADSKINLKDGDNFSTKLGSDGTVKQFKVISTLGASHTSTTGTDLQGINGNLAGNFALGADLDASATAGWSRPAGTLNAGETNVGLSSIGSGAAFTGSFDGLGHTISNLTATTATSTPTTANASVGLFATTNGATLQNLGLVNGTFRSREAAGALVGTSTNDKIDNVFSKSTVNGGYDTGGLIGQANASTISNVYNTGAVSGYWYVGGVVGRSRSSSINAAYNTGAVSADQFAGGILGQAADNHASISTSVRNAYNTGTISATRMLGGVVGSMYNSYSSGSPLYTQGPAPTVTNSYNTGLLKKGSTSLAAGTAEYAGGVVSSWLSGVGRDALVVGSYWDTSYITTSGGGSGAVGKSSSQLMTASTFTGWDLDSTGGTGKVWRIYDGFTMPLLRRFMPALDLGGASSSVVYNGQTQSLSGGLPPGVDTSKVLGSGSSGRNVGTYSGNYSNQQGYDIVGQATLSITKADLQLTTTNVSKEYDGTLAGSGTATVKTGTLYGTDSISGGSFEYTTKAAGIGNKTVNVSSVTVEDGNNGGNYNVTYAPNTTSTITQRAITVAATGGDKTYDGTLNTTVSLASSGVVSGDAVSFDSTSATFATKTKGAGKTVTVTGITKSGDHADNYTLSNTSAQSTAEISARGLKLSVLAANKDYDATTAATVTISSSGVVTGDNVTFSKTSATFDTAAVGERKLVTVSGISLGGADADNYLLGTTTGMAGASIGMANLVIKANDASRFMGLPDPTFTAAITGFFGSDNASNSLTGTLNLATNATASSLNGFYAIIPSGVSSSNYNVSYQNGTFTIKAADAATYMTGGTEAAPRYVSAVKSAHTVPGTAVWVPLTNVPTTQSAGVPLPPGAWVMPNGSMTYSQ